MPGTQTRRHSDALLLLVCLAQFMVILDVSIVNVALPSIQDSLDFSDTGLQWVVNAYTLTFAGFLMLGGRACDLFGRREVFLGGTALFAVASLACALADSQPLLLGARALQGLGAATISPAGLAIIAASFPEGPERNRALGVWGAMAGLGGSSGALFGGLLTQGLGWPAIFVINVPVGLAVLAAGRRWVPRNETASGRGFDAVGAVLVTAGLTALVYAIVRTDTLGWTAPGVTVPAAIAVALLGLFALYEGRVASDPLVPLGIFRRPLIRTSNIVMALLYSGAFSMWFFVSLYLQDVRHLDALEAGVAFLPLTIGFFAASSFSPRLVKRFGAANVLTGGLLTAAIGLALLGDVPATGTFLDIVLPAGVISTLGFGTAFVPVMIVAVQGVEPRETGLASGLVNTSRLVGGTLGLAAFSTAAASYTSSHSAASAALALTDGYQLAFLLSSATTLVGAVVGATLLRRHLRPVAQGAGATQEA
ncbi:MAG TPA: MFS transporter [Solirubrobacterales bacterium]|jgi:EmrB/QacA subfamily drug resistance transporter|nr:MFS transporter [Solirubrobacterales bacterium]